MFVKYNTYDDIILGYDSYTWLKKKTEVTNHKYESTVYNYSVPRVKKNWKSFVYTYTIYIKKRKLCKLLEYIFWKK